MMEIASTNYLADLLQVDVMEDYPVTTFDEYPTVEDCFAYTLDDEINKSLSSDHEFVAPPTARATKKLKTFETMPPPPPTPSSQHIISFDHHYSSSQVAHDEDEDCTILFNYDHSRKYYKAATTARNPVQAQEHVIAERKRREKLSQSFVALSAMLPGLKKMDKASILGDAIKYVKQLEERLQILEEEQATNERTIESAVLVKRCYMFDDENNNNCNSRQQYEEWSSSSSSSSLPEMQARVSGKEVLIRVQCKKENGREAIAAILTQLEKHHLIVQTTTSLPFGSNTLDITILAQMKEEYLMSAKELLGSLRLALTCTSS